MHLNKPTITSSKSTLLNEQLQLLYSLEKGLEQFIELSEYKQAFL
jgi:hypothetical protein